MSVEKLEPNMMRLHLEAQQKIVTPPDIKAALDDMHRIREDHPTCWASFEADAFGEGDLYWRTVKVHWGTRHTNGDIERMIQTISYSLGDDGDVTRSRITHL